MQNKQPQGKKQSHNVPADLQEKIMAYAREIGDVPSATTMIRQKFDLSITTAYYYRRKAFGYRRGKRLPVHVVVSPDAGDVLLGLVDSGKYSTKGDAATNIILNSK